MSRVDRYRRAREIFVQAIELAPAERVLLLDADCTGDPELRAEVDSLPAIEAAFGAASPRGSYALQIRLAVCRGLGKSEEADAIQRRLAEAK